MTRTVRLGRGAGLFAVLQLSDSAFPAGLFTQSGGLETAVAEGTVRGEAGLAAWVADLLALSVAPLDGRAAAACWRAAGRGDLAAVLAADARLESMRLCREPRVGSARSGRGLLATAAGVPAARRTASRVLAAFARAAAAGETPGHHATAFGVVGRAWGAALQPLLCGLLFSAASGAVGAAVRLGAADHRAAQRVLASARVWAGRLAAAAAVEGAPWWSFSPAAEIAAMRHEAARVRLFTT